jgi:hypothetical protein
MTFIDGSNYDGDWFENKKHGTGKNTWTNSIMKDSFKTMKFTVLAFTNGMMVGATMENGQMEK